MNLVLGGDVSTNFKFGRPEDYAAATEACRLDQETICGYPLVVKGTRQSHYQDENGRDVYDVFVTFGPAPPAPPADATQAPPAT